MFERKKQLLWSKLKVGTVVTLALLVLLFTVFFAGGIESLLSPTADVKALMHDVKGLRRGAPVWLSGIEIGSVRYIRLTSEYGAVITLALKKSALPFVKKDSHASVLTLGLLGDKYVELSGGSSQAGPLSPGDTIEGVAHVELKDIMETSAGSIEKLTGFIEKLESLVIRIEKGEGTIARLISDPSVYDNLKEATKNLASAMKDMKDARGTLGLLVEDPTLYNKMVSAASSVEDFGKKLNDGSGTLGKLANDPTLYNRLLSATTSLDDFGKKLSEGQGTLKKLAEDPALYDNLNQASQRISSIVESIDRGEGVAGSLVKDQELAGQLKEILAEISALAKDIRENPRRYFKFSIL
ncbi:MAG TPA: MlaD family protein [Thermodesulfovibrionales bacterium]|nr:MlaD family protein [Thermodesulfovibrionales bacterium]